MMGLFDMLVYAVLLAGLVAILLIVLKALKIPVPDWFVNICWVVLAVAVAVFAMRLIISMAGVRPLW